MKGYRWRDVPPGERLSYFLTYYKWPALGLMFALFLVFGLIKTIFFTGRTDLSILWLTDRYSLTEEDALRERLKHLPLDVNGDGENKPSLQYVAFAADYEQLSLDVQMELLTLMGTGEFNVFFASPAARDWLMERQAAGTWGDFGAIQTEHKAEDIFCVPLEELPAFQDIGGKDALYLMVAKPPVRASRPELYRAQMDALTVFFTERGDSHVE